jgi:hypothetical protein
MKLNPSNGNASIKYELFKDSCLIPSKSLQNNKTISKFINIPSLNFKVIENDSSGFLNSSVIDGILGLSYNNNPGSQNFINVLYNEGYISSHSFSIIITSSNINRLYLGDIMKNKYINNHFKYFEDKGQCSIIGNKWKCELKHLEYKPMNNSLNKNKKILSSSNVNFNIKENKLTIPREYYDLIVREGYKMVKRKNSTLRHKQFNRNCRKFGEIIYCMCKRKKDFGKITFDFGNYSTLDIDLRDYVHYDRSAFFYKCRTDIILSDNNEFVIGLKGLNNTILTFNAEDKTIKFFRQKPKIDMYWFLIFILIVVGFLCFLSWLFYF